MLYWKPLSLQPLQHQIVSKHAGVQVGAFFKRHASSAKQTLAQYPPASAALRATSQYAGTACTPAKSASDPASKGYHTSTQPAMTSTSGTLASAASSGQNDVQKDAESQSARPHAVASAAQKAAADEASNGNGEAISTSHLNLTMALNEDYVQQADVSGPSKPTPRLHLDRLETPSVSSTHPGEMIFRNELRVLKYDFERAKEQLPSGCSCRDQLPCL